MGRPFGWSIRALAVAAAAALAAAGIGIGAIAHFAFTPASNSALGKAVPYDYIGAEAIALRMDPAAMVSFVRDQIGTDAYPGVLRGPVATLWGLSGSDLDRSLLLQALLARAHRRSILVHGSSWGVEVDDGHGSLTYVGPTLAADPTAVASTPSAAEFQTVRIGAHTVDSDGNAVDEPVGTFRTADLAANDIHIFYRVKGKSAHLAVEGPHSSITVSADAATAKSQSLIVTLASPGVASILLERELFTTAYDGYVSFFDPSNRYSITVSTGWLTDNVAMREGDSLKAPLSNGTGPSGWDAINHMVAYRFLAQSDDSIRSFAKQQSIAAHLTSPRVTIVANERDPESKGRSLSIDLLKDDLAVDASVSNRLMINTTHSLYDASLEAEVLQSVTGQQTQSAADSLATAVSSQPSTLGQRLLIVAYSLNQLLGDDVVDGTAVVVSPKVRPDLSVSFTRSGDSVQAQASPALVIALAGSHDGAIRWLLSSPPIKSDVEQARAASAAEIALANAAHLPIDYQTEYRTIPTTRFYWHVTQFVPGNPVQQLRVAVRPGLTISALPYYAGNNAPPNPGPLSNDLSTANISDDDLQNATVIQDFFPKDDATHGYTFQVVSRKVYAELKSKGSALVRFNFLDGTVSDVVRLYVVGHRNPTITVNGRDMQVNVLDLNGDYEKNHRSRPKDLADGPKLIDPSNTVDGAFNKFVILDDPEYPLYVGLFQGGDNQSALPGTVVDAATGRPVPGATVKLVEPDVSGTSWPDGTFSIPAFDQPLGTFTVHVEAAGYKTLDRQIDISNPAALPLKLALQPVKPVQATWITQANVDTVFSSLTLSRRSQDLITAAVTSDPLVSVLVPGETANTQFGPIDAWLEINAATGEMFPLLPDGLHGASTVRDLTGIAAGSAAGCVELCNGMLSWPGNQAEEWIRQNAANPFEPDRAIREAPIAWFAGHVAGWYYFAAGALNGVQANIANPSLTTCDLHKITMRTARAMVEGTWVEWGLTVAGTTAESWTLQWALDLPSAPFLNNKANGFIFKSSAHAAITNLGHATDVAWGLVGGACD